MKQQVLVRVRGEEGSPPGGLFTASWRIPGCLPSLRGNFQTADVRYPGISTFAEEGLLVEDGFSMDMPHSYLVLLEQGKRRKLDFQLHLEEAGPSFDAAPELNEIMGDDPLVSCDDEPMPLHRSWLSPMPGLPYTLILIQRSGRHRLRPLPWPRRPMRCMISGLSGITVI